MKASMNIIQKSRTSFFIKKKQKPEKIKYPEKFKLENERTLNLLIKPDLIFKIFQIGLKLRRSKTQNPHESESTQPL